MLPITHCQARLHNAGRATLRLGVSVARRWRPSVLHAIRKRVLVPQRPTRQVRHFTSYSRKVTPMPKYVIDRNIPGAGKMSETDLKTVSQTSCGVLRKLGSEIQWLHSYVTDDKIYCVYIAPNEAVVREHAQQGGFPANSIAV